MTEQAMRPTVGPEAVLTRARPEEQARVMRAAGVLFGALFALFYAAICWGYDAWLLREAGVHLWWAKLAVGLALAVPLSMLAAGLAARSGRAWVRAAVWIPALVLLVYLTAHTAYELLGWVYALDDPYPAPYGMYTQAAGQRDFMYMDMAIAAAVGVAVALVEEGALAHAWSNVTARRRIGPDSLLSLAVRALPLALVLGAPAGDMLNGTTRKPLLSVADTFSQAADPATDLRVSHLTYLAPFRQQLAAPFTLYWNEAPEAVETGAWVIDARLADGQLLRCNYANGSVILCVDLGAQAEQALRGLMSVGHLTCGDCGYWVERDVRIWLAAELPGLGPPRTIGVLRHEGGWFYERVTFDGGRAIDCRLRGDGPIVLDLCVEAH